jgi:MerR family transcriptional regulator/heat shock protein HspR
MGANRPVKPTGALSVEDRQLDPDHALYGISVAAELTGVNPQMLRAYETKGLIRPYRTDGGTRRYSGRDLAIVDRITTLLAAGLNLAGVEQVLALEAQTRTLRAEIDDLQEQLGDRTPPDTQRKT